MAQLTRAQLDEISDYLAAGMSPDAIADLIGRIADLDYLDIITIRSVAYDLSRGQTVHAKDE